MDLVLTVLDTPFRMDDHGVLRMGQTRVLARQAGSPFEEKMLRLLNERAAEQT